MRQVALRRGGSVQTVKNLIYRAKEQTGIWSLYRLVALVALEDARERD